MSVNYIFIAMCIKIIWAVGQNTTIKDEKVEKDKILLLSMPTSSHLEFFKGAAYTLTQNGYDVYFLLNEISTKKYDDSIKKSGAKILTIESEFDIEASLDVKFHERLEEARSGLDVIRIHSALMQQVITNVWQYVDDILTNENFMNKLKLMNFKMAIIDSIFFTAPLHMIAQNLDITATATLGVVKQPRFSGLTILPSIEPLTLLELSNRMTFLQRIQNYILNIMLYEILSLIPHNASMFEKHNKDSTKQNLVDIVSESDLWIFNTEHIMDYPRAAMPNTVYIGASTVYLPLEPLPDELAKLMDAASDGIVYLSMGSHLKLNNESLEKLLNVFEIADQSIEKNVYYFFQGDPARVTVPASLKGKMTVQKWYPQRTMLSHRNMRVFITHCGNSGMYEALRYGVPMIGIPISLDQFYNSVRITANGWGYRFDRFNFVSDELAKAIVELMTSDNPHTAKIKRDSDIFNSQREFRDANLVSLVRLVIDYGGEHMFNSGKDLSVWELYSFDVLAFLLISLHVIIYLLYRVAKYVLRYCYSNGKYKSE